MQPSFQFSCMHRTEKIEDRNCFRQLKNATYNSLQNAPYPVQFAHVTKPFKHQPTDANGHYNITLLYS